MDLVMECENFVRDCDALYAKSLIVGFTAMEGEKLDAVKTAGRAAWEKLKELCRKIAEAIGKGLTALGTFMSKLNPLKSKLPNEVLVVDPNDIDILDEFNNVVGNVGEAQAAAAEMERVSAKVKQAASTIETAKEAQEQASGRVQEIVDELDDLTDRLLNNMKKGPKGAAAAAESDVFLFSAMEASGGRKFNVSKIKDMFFGGLDAAKKGFSGLKNAADDLRNRIAAAAGKAGTKAAGLYGKLLTSLSKAQAAVHKFSAWCGDKIRTLFNLVRKSKSGVSDYDGPEPDLA